MKGALIGGHLLGYGIAGVAGAGAAGYLGVKAGADFEQTKQNALMGAVGTTATVGALEFGAIQGVIGISSLAKKSAEKAKTAAKNSKEIGNMLRDNADGLALRTERKLRTVGNGLHHATSTAISTVGRGAVKYGNIAQSMFKPPDRPLRSNIARKFKSDDTNQLFKLSKTGAATVGAGFAITGVVNAFNTYENARKGYHDGTTTTATPQPVSSSMMRNAGATGDLNFAMHRNRRG